MRVAQFLFLFFITCSLEARECDLKSPLKTYKPKYATHFSIDYFKNFKIVHVDSERYLLSLSKNLECEMSLQPILIPVKKVAMMSTTYLPALELIKEEKSLIAFQGKQYIVSKAFDKNGLKEISFKYNPESLLALNADLVMGYDSNLTSPKQKDVLAALKIPVVINRDFEEKTPLARAEWLIFISSFYDKEDVGLKYFNLIKDNYQTLKIKNAKYNKKPKVLVGEIQNGYWVTCGGSSDLAQMIADAGGELVLSKPGPETQKISLEEFSQLKRPFDIWLPHNMWKTHDDLLAAIKSDKRYTMATAKKVYNNNLVMNSYQSNDYWEMAMQRPDLLLKDLTMLFHPEADKNYKLQWYRPL